MKITSDEESEKDILNKAFDILEKDSNAAYLFTGTDITTLRNDTISSLYNLYVKDMGSFDSEEEAVANWFVEDAEIDSSSARKLFVKEFNSLQNNLRNELNDENYVNNVNKRKETIDSLKKEIYDIVDLQDKATGKYLDKDFEWFLYKNSLYRNEGEDNKFLMRYEDIQGKNESQQTVFLDTTTSIINFFSKYRPNGFTSDTDFCGAFIYPNLNHKNVVMTNGGEKDSISIDVSESITVPIVFEYYLNGTDNNKTVTKSIYFDIRNSLISNPLHYMIEVTGNYDYTATGDIYNNFSEVELSDSVTD